MNRFLTAFRWIASACELNTGSLMLDPELLLLDEPLGALDPMIRYELQQELKNIFNQLGKSVVMVTHDIAEAAYFSDSLVLIRGWHIIQFGTFKDLTHRPADSFVKQFIAAQCEPMERVTKILR